MKIKHTVIILILVLCFIVPDLAYGCDPTAILNVYPSSVKLGEPVALDGSDSYIANNKIVLYEWDYDYDGSFVPDYNESTAEDGIYEHTYETEGIHTAALRVTEDEGHWDIDTVVIMVTTNIRNITQDNKPYLSIQAAIDDANNFDEIEVDPGTYYENIDLSDVNVTIRSTDPNDWLIVGATVIHANDANFATVTFNGSQDSNTVLAGFRISGGLNGIECNDTSPIIQNCIITDNGQSSHLGGGIYDCNGAFPLISNCFIVDNDANYGAGIYNIDSFPTIRNCVISNNFSVYDGGGLYDVDSLSLVLNCTFTDNDADNGGGMYCTGGLSEPNLISCIFWDNSAVTDGSQIYNDGADPNYKYCNIQDSNGSGENWDSFLGNDGGGNIDQDPCFITIPEPDANGLISLWKLDEGSGSQAQDSVGDNNGVIIDSLQWAEGRIEGALDFNGVSGHVEIPDDDSLTPSDKLTVAFWLYNRGGQGAGVFKYASCPGEPASPGESRSYIVNVISSTSQARLNVYTSVGENDILDSNNPVGLNSWHHITATFDEGQAKIYVDGILDASETLSVSSIMNDDQPLIFGGIWSYCGTDSFVHRLNGVIDDVRIYNKILSEAEVREVCEYGLFNQYKYRFNYNSPCINAGDPNADTSETSAEDILNDERIRAGRIDIGAYEGGQTIYVDCHADPNGDGQSWDTAFNDLQDGLADANAGDEIWVADGNYTPGPEGVRTVTFQLINGVALYGGFDGNEVYRQQRDWQANITMLSGDLGGDDGPDFANYDENAYHVVTGSSTNESAVLDGFKITGGNASAALGADRTGGGLLVESGSLTIKNCSFSYNAAKRGGAICFNNSGGTLIGDIFSNNCSVEESSYGGGAIWNHSGGSPNFTGCIFKNNTAYHSGGAVRLNDACTSIFNNCVFFANSADYRGGGVFIGENNTNPCFINCSFVSNTAENNCGGGLYHYSGSSTVINCIFWNNSDSGGQDESSQIHGGNPVVDNSCVQGVWSGTGDNNISSDPCFVNIESLEGFDGIMFTIDDGLRIAADSCCVDAAAGNFAPQTDILGLGRVDISQVANTGSGTPDYADIGAYESYDTYDSDSDGMDDDWEEYYGFDPDNPNDASLDADEDGLTNLEEFNNKTNPYDSDTDNDGLPDNWEVETGLNALDSTDAAEDSDSDDLTNTQEYAESTDPLDDDTDGDEMPDGWEVANGLDPLDNNGDYGADGDPDNDGKTNLQEYQGETNPQAYTILVPSDANSIQNAVDDCNDGYEIIVSQGIYYENIVIADKAITIRSTNPCDTNVVTATVIDANDYEGSTVIISDENLPQGSVIFSGFTVTGAGGDIWTGGIDIDCNDISVTINNCIIRNNETSGLLCCGQGSVSVENSIIRNNQSHDGAGIELHGLETNVYNCVIVDNNSAGSGGGLFNDESDLHLINCIFSGNSSAYYGGAIHLKTSDCMITNCTITENSSLQDGGGIYTFEDVNIINCIVWDNSVFDGNNDEIRCDANGLFFRYSCVKGSGGSSSWNNDYGTDGGGNIDQDPLLVTPSLPAGCDGIFFTADDGLRLRSNSPCTDAADGDLATSTDILGLERFDDDAENSGTGTPDYADIGAYEVDPNVPSASEETDGPDWNALKVNRWDQKPTKINHTSISMSVNAATDESGVQYYFQNVTDGNHDSGWQDSPTYVDTNLVPETPYEYQVKARDKSANLNQKESSLEDTTTDPDPDTTAPTPGTMTWDIAPDANGCFSIYMVATTASDDSGVEYYFENVTIPDHNSGWQNSPSYEDTGLDMDTSYTYRVKARDKSYNHNETSWSSQAGDTTDPDPDEDPPTSQTEWATSPTAISSTAVLMTAKAVSDQSGVEYYFDETSENPGGSDSGWQNSPTYIDAGLNPNTNYTYTVTARDKSDNLNAAVAASGGATTSVDNGPTPNPMAFAVPPYAVSSSSVSMVAAEANDPDGGIEYYFKCVSGGGNDSPWQSSTIYTDSGLDSNTVYEYRVKARDVGQQENTYSQSYFVRTLAQTGSTPEGTADAVSGALGNDLGLNVDLFTGAASYSVPIVVPPARGGSEPKISLNYSSGSGNGWCGLGWSLGMGAIQRDTKHGVPVKWQIDGENVKTHMNQYDDEKGFTVAFGAISSRLVLIDDVNNIYHSETDQGFLKYIFDQQNNKWIVIDKGGTRYYFGETYDARMVHPYFVEDESGENTFLWALERIVDTSGNRTLLEYATDANQIYLNSVRYNGNINSPQIEETHTIEFEIEDRNDVSISYATGYRIETRKRLSEIVVKVGETLVRRYDLDYEYSPSTLRSLLKSVTMYGVSDTDSLPPVTFDYQTKPFEFDETVDWGFIDDGRKFAQLNASPFCTTSYRGSTSTRVGLLDIDGDGLPDRIKKYDSKGPKGYRVQLNTGTGFAEETSWNSDGGYMGIQWTRSKGGYSYNYRGFIDFDGDGLLDVVRQRKPGIPSLDRYSPEEGNNTLFFYRNNGLGIEKSKRWGPLYSQNRFNSSPQGIAMNSFSARKKRSVIIQMVDINGDGLPDRVMRKLYSPYGSYFTVQFNTGSGFEFKDDPNTGFIKTDWGPIDSQGDNQFVYWNSIQGTNSGDSYVELFDINGDGLPDRVMRERTENQGGASGAYDVFRVQFNTGYGFEKDIHGKAVVRDWGQLYSQDLASVSWNSVQAADQRGSCFHLDLFDINGDGLPDRVMRPKTKPYGKFIIELNTGSGFTHQINGSDIEWTGVDSEGNKAKAWNSIRYITSKQTKITMIDINSDGLVDRVMCEHNKKRGGDPKKYDVLRVQYNKGPIPDLLSKVNGRLGGSVELSYKVSTSADTHDRHKDNQGINRLPMPVYTVSSVTVDDGFDNESTTIYEHHRGFYNAARKEFGGFGEVTVTDPCGTKSVTYFHQGGGYNNPNSGEFEDAGSIAKRGTPYRVEVYGSDTNLYSVTINKVEEVNVIPDSNWHFAYVSQTIMMDYEGTENYRATAQQFEYDMDTGNVLKSSNLGEVSDVNTLNHTFDDIGDDSFFVHTTYASFTDVNIIGKTGSVLTTSDSEGTTKLKETVYDYNDATALVTDVNKWLNTADDYITTKYEYDQYGNRIKVTDAEGYITQTVYDSNYAIFPVEVNTADFVTTAEYDVRSGLPLLTTDVIGISTENIYDQFYRLTDVYVSTVPDDDPNLWLTHIEYNMDGINNGKSENYVHQVHEGYEAYTYNDGLGRVIQTRVKTESGADGDCRVANVLYDDRGKVYFEPLPYFSDGNNFTIFDSNTDGTRIKFDTIGRAYRIIPPTGDTGSPTGPTTTAFKDGSNLWVNVITDAEENVKKQYFDAYGRVTTLVEVVSGGSVTTEYEYDKLGRLISTTDDDDNIIAASYDSLGRKVDTNDPDMGYWMYQYDNLGRLTDQNDARGNRIELIYEETINRISEKRIYDDSNTPTETITYTYDEGDDQDFVVYKGLLYKVTDAEGFQQFGYDKRGRQIKSNRKITAHSNKEYLTQTSYDDAGRVKKLIYPDDRATIEYSYDSAGHLVKVESTDGTPTSNEIFYQPSGFNAENRLTGIDYGNGVETRYTFYTNSRRLKNIDTNDVNEPIEVKLQKLTYTYDKVSDVNNIVDGLYENDECSTLSNIQYDSLYRVTMLYSEAIGDNITYEYNSIGNITNNGERGGSGYTYSSTRPHAVVSAWGKSYGYDSCGNMTDRGDDDLTYDEQNRLISVVKDSNTISFGYGYDDIRLYKKFNGSVTQVWIGDIYEEKGDKVLCHVYAAGRLIATFEPESTIARIMRKHPYLARTCQYAGVTCYVLFGDGRTPTTLLGMGIVFGLYYGLRRRKDIHGGYMLFYRNPYRQITGMIILVSVFVAGSPEICYAGQGDPDYDPVFYYYHSDHLGSSEIMTDRDGDLVQHYGYYPFGDERYSENGLAFSVSNRYTSQILDEDTGLYYYGARYYDPELGRFIQADPIIPGTQNSQAFNRYSYVSNNPLKFIDPSGNTLVSNSSYWWGSSWGSSYNYSSYSYSSWSTFSFSSISYDFGISSTFDLGTFNLGSFGNYNSASSLSSYASGTTGYWGDTHSSDFMFDDFNKKPAFDLNLNLSPTLPLEWTMRSGLSDQIPMSFSTLRAWEHSEHNPWGHMSFELSDRTYYSRWPKEGWSPLRVMPKETIWNTYEDDVAEMGKPDLIMRISSEYLNEYQVKDWFETTNQSELSFTHFRKCTDTCMSALEAGGMPVENFNTYNYPETAFQKTVDVLFNKMDPAHTWSNEEKKSIRKLIERGEYFP